MTEKQKIYLKEALAEDSAQVQAGRGKNIIPPPEKESLWKRYFEKFNDPLILILFAALVLSVALVIYEVTVGVGGLKLFIEPIGIAVAILLSTGIGFWVELKAEKEFEVLNTVNDDETTKVYRKFGAEKKTELVTIAKKDVVVGDFVRVEAGDSIPADGILVNSNQLTVDESMFTGEPFTKKCAIIPDISQASGNTLSVNNLQASANTLSSGNLQPSANPADNDDSTYPKDLLLRGATVIEGNGVYKVSHIGLDTEEAKGIALASKKRDVRTPLSRQLDGLGKWISYVSMVVGILVLLARVVYYFCIANFDEAPDMVDEVAYVLESVMIAVTLVVAAVPEGLPMSITMSLAMSMRKMIKEKNLVRRLHACETMGATTVICTDKTGTLTQNRMKVNASLVPDEAIERVMLDVAVNSTATLNRKSFAGEGLKVVGNPTEGALLNWIEELKPGTDGTLRYQALREAYEIKEQKPFSTETKYMESVASGADFQNIHLLKGAPEVIMSMCDAYCAGLTKELVQQTLVEYQAKAMRTLAFAADGEFLGIVGISDPIRLDVPEAIRVCKDEAHVKVIIVTGDTPGTANEIGRQIGLLEENEYSKTLTGSEFAALDDAKIRLMLAEGKIKIIARAKPEDKARLVKLLQQNKEVVAVTGDGTNDAPALAKAHVGLSMGDGTARAKDASDITIIDNSFASINKAILWGRSIYKNIRRFIVFQTIVNVCACLIVLFGACVGLDSPLNVMQMLWVNLIMDTFAALALSTLPADPNVMHEKPRAWNAHIITRKTAGYIFSYAIFFFIGLAILWMYMYRYNNTGGAMHLSGNELGVFFSTFVFIQFWNLFNTRYFDTNRSYLRDVVNVCRDKLQWWETFNWTFIGIGGVIFFGQILIVQCCGEVFGVEPLTLRQLAYTIICTSLAFVIPEMYRLIRKPEK